jgi:hypothetical protein
VQSDTQSGKTRIAVVKQHLASALRSMSGAHGAEFGIALFDTGCQLPLGDKLLKATKSGVSTGLSAVSGIRAGGGNGGEAACLKALLKMGPHAVFFLGDGGWDSSALIAAAGGAKAKGVTIHSIAFFTTGGGLPEIASLTGGTYREIQTTEDL